MAHVGHGAILTLVVPLALLVVVLAIWAVANRRLATRRRGPGR